MSRPFSMFRLYGLAAIVLATLVGGVLRGFTGGAGAVVVIMPVLSAFVGAREAVPVGVCLMLLTGFQLGRRAIRDADIREAVTLSISSVLLVPAGIWLLFSVDEELMRQAVAGMAILFAAILLSGWRHSGPRGPAIAAVAGGLSGLIGGAVGMGGPRCSSTSCPARRRRMSSAGRSRSPVRSPRSPRWPRLPSPAPSFPGSSG